METALETTATPTARPYELRSGAALVRLAFIGTAVAATALAHHFTPVENIWWHNVYQRLYYVPILAAAFWFGLRGALMTSALSAASYLPHIVMDWGEMRGIHDEYLQAQYAEIVMFQVVAIVVGLLTESERHARERQERTARELAEAYAQLQESFEQLRRADRLTALGELSAGLAHEIKNPLASVKASFEILLSESTVRHEKREFAEIVNKELNQLETIVHEFLQFARTPKPVLAPCDLTEVAASVKVLCEADARDRGVAIELDADPQLPEVEVDAPQLQQALLNVVLNGIQAMTDGGILRIQLNREDDRARIRVCDEGEGVQPDARDRLFEPFYTTKARGTGLGLAIARKLVEAQGGELALADAPGETGACFDIHLPNEERVED